MRPTWFRPALSVVRKIVVAAAALVLIHTPLRATTITPGQTGVSPTNFGVLPTTVTPLDQIMGTFSLDGGAVMGEYIEGVVVDPFGMICTGCLDFYFQVGNSSASTLNITSVGLDGLFPMFSDNVGYVTETGGTEIAPISAAFGTATPAAPITEFLTLTPGGPASDILVIATNATAYAVNGNLGIGYVGGAGPVIPGMLTPVAAPEPQSIYLLGIGLLGLIGLRFRNKRIA